MANLFEYLFGNQNAQPNNRSMNDADREALLRRQSGQPTPSPKWDNYNPQQGNPSMAEYQAARQQIADQAAARDAYMTGNGPTAATDRAAPPRIPAKPMVNPTSPVPETGLPAYQGNGGFTFAREQSPEASPIAQAMARQADPTSNAQAFDPFPEHYRDWSWWDVMRNPFAPNGEAIYKAARAADQPNMPEDANSVSGATLPDGGFISEGYMSGDDTVNPDDVQYVAPEAGPDDTVPTNPLDDIRRQKEMIDSLYPQMPAQDIGQDALDDDAAKEKQRTNYLAQLAFFSGITQGAGGSWEGVGKGLAAAGAAQSAGFDRYRKALEGKSARMQKQANAQYDQDTAKTNAAIKLYGEDTDRKKTELSESRLRIKERADALDTKLKAILDANKAGDIDTPEKQAARDQAMAEYRLERSRLFGTDDFVTSHNVSD